MFFQDNESKVDLLYYESTAKTIASLLKRRDSSPLSIGIHGTWGAGKSTILCQLEEHFADGPFLCVRFNGWLFQGYEDARLVLLNALLGSVKDRLGVDEKAKDKIKDLFKRLNWLSVAKSVGSLGATVLTGIPVGALSTLGTGLSAVVEQLLGTGKVDLKKLKLDMPKEGLKLFDPQKVESVPAQIQAFRKDFESLLDNAEIKRLIVLIDDLDRCLPEATVGILEAYKLFLFVNKTAFVIAADEAMIEYAVSKHFGGLQSTSGEMHYTRSYLEKLIQVPFRISNLGRNETSIYVSLLLLQATLELQEENFQRILDLALQLLRQPWLEEKLDATLVLQTLEHIDEVTENEVKRMMKVSIQVSDTLAGLPQR